MTRIQKMGIRILTLALCLVGMLTLALPASAAEQEPEVSAFTYTTLVRYRASASSYVIGQMEDGTVLKVLGQSGNYYKVDCYDMNGYIAKSQVAVNENGEYYVNCNPDSSETTVMDYATPAEALQMRSALMTVADAQLGVRYVYGGTTPRGFDCSGFTSYVYKNNGYSLHRTSTQQLQDGVIVAREDLQVGDLIFFKGGSNITSHVGIYAGDNQIIHAGSRGICYADLDTSWFANNYLCARRVVNTSVVELEVIPTVDVENALVHTATQGLRSAS